MASFLCRVDLSDLHAYDARKQFAAAVQKGEAGINLAEAALHISAEDDAIASHSTVRLPVDAFLKRIEQLSGELATMHLRHTEDAEPEAILQVSGFSKLLCWTICRFAPVAVDSTLATTHAGSAALPLHHKGI